MMKQNKMQNERTNQRKLVNPTKKEWRWHVAGSPCPVAGCWSKNPPIRDMITLTIREIANTATKRKASMVTSAVKSAAASCSTIAAPASTTLPIVAPTYFTKDGRSPTCAFCCLVSSSFARFSPIACWAA